MAELTITATATDATGNTVTASTAVTVEEASLGDDNG
jgi:hypothetical protein